MITPIEKMTPEIVCFLKDSEAGPYSLIGCKVSLWLSSLVMGIVEERAAHSRLWGEDLDSPKILDRSLHDFNISLSDYEGLKEIVKRIEELKRRIEG